MSEVTRQIKYLYFNIKNDLNLPKTEWFSSNKTEILFENIQLKKLPEVYGTVHLWASENYFTTIFVVVANSHETID